MPDRSPVLKFAPGTHFCTLLNQYLVIAFIYQVSEKQRRPGQSQALFYLEKNDNRQNSLLDGISEFLQPLELNDQDLTTTKKNLTNITKSDLKICPMIPPNLHGAVQVVSKLFILKTIKRPKMSTKND